MNHFSLVPIRPFHFMFDNLARSRPGPVDVTTGPLLAT
jgi:hypothetical protein